MRLNYDDYDNYTFSDPPTNTIVLNETSVCGIGNEFNKNRSCTVSFTTTKYMEPPILIHYELRNFHQNHRDYFKSFDPYQLLGKNVIAGVNQDEISAKYCQVINKLGDIQINPCGLIANTFFNDYFTLLDGKDIYGNDLIMVEEGIAWKSDLKFKFRQPDGFNYSVCENGCDDTTCCLPNDSCTTPYYNKSDGLCYRFYYPNDNKTQYLYETYPDKISPIQGVTNEHFVNWMRIATLSTFRKLYGYIEQPIAANTTITFQINSNYVVLRARGGKSLLIGTTSIFGGSNPYLWRIFYTVGIFCFVVGIFFSIKLFFFPRKLADPKYLHYKEE